MKLLIYDKNFVLIVNMLYILKIDDYLKVQIDEEVEDFIAINFSKCYKYARKEQNFRKVAKPFYTFLTTLNEVRRHLQ